MNERNKTVFLDEEIDAEILAIIREAKERVVLVTPYLVLWGHAQDAIGVAVKKGIRVTVLIRNDQNLNEGKIDSILWLLRNGVGVWAVERLHAKIYMNEHTLLVSSMNMLQSSVENSLEIALLVSNEHEQQKLRGYVTNMLWSMATPVSLPSSTQSSQQSVGQPAVVVSHPNTGVCIRCGQPHFFDPSKPLCDDCYESWAEYGNKEYQEHFCLRCGRPAEVTYAKPLCWSCYRSLP